MGLFLMSIEEYVDEEEPERTYDDFVESLSMEDIEINCKKVGNSQYDPKAMLKLLIYEYSYDCFASYLFFLCSQGIFDLVFLIFFNCTHIDFWVLFKVVVKGYCF